MGSLGCNAVASGKFSIMFMLGKTLHAAATRNEGRTSLIGSG